MPGIYGFVCKNKNRENLNHMTNALNHNKKILKDDDYYDEHFAASHIHLGNMKNNTNFFFREGVYISVEGECYNHKGKLFEDVLFNSYLNNTLERTLNNLDGYFNAVVYDLKKKKIFLISDRYGMRMLYYYHKDQRFAFSGELKGLLSLGFVDKCFDPKQIDIFLDLGYLLEDNTWFKHIKLMKPSTILEFDIKNKSLSQKYYWKWSSIKKDNISYEKAIDAVGELFLDSVKKRFDPNENIGISLSGGLDSRAILAAIQKLYPDYKGFSYTFGIDNCDDLTIAKKIVKKTNWEHKEYNFCSPEWFNKRIDKVWLTDGMMSLMHMHGIEFAEDLCNFMSYNLNGYAGDIVCGGGFLIPAFKNNFADIRYLKTFYKNQIKLCKLNDDYYTFSTFEPHLYINRLRRFTNMGSVNHLQYIDQRKPFFDNNLVEFIFSLPEDFRIKHKLYIAMLLNHFPDFFKHIPWQYTGKTIDKGLPSNFFHRTIQKIKRVSYKLGILHNKSDFFNYQNWLKEKQIIVQIKNLLNNKNCLYKKHTDIDFYERYFIPHLKYNKNNSDIILRAVTIEIYLNYLEKEIH